MSKAVEANQELVNKVNNHLNSISRDLERIHSDIQEIVVIEEREAEELSPQNQRAFPDEQRAVMRLNRVLEELETILGEGIEAIVNMDRYLDIGDNARYDTGDPGSRAAGNYIRVIATLGKHTIKALQVQIKFEAEVEEVNSLKNGELDLSENQRQQIKEWVSDCLEILEDIKEVLRETLNFGEEMVNKYDDDEYLYDYVEKYRGNIIGGELERIEREEEELQQIAQNL